MLVVIVVAAATAFAFFVASYQKQLQAEETKNHDRALEGVKAIDVAEVSCQGFPTHCYSNASGTSFASVSFVVASLDVNTIVLTGLFLNGRGIVNYTATFANGTTVAPCYDDSAHIPGNRTSGLVPCAPLALGSYSTVTFQFDLNENTSSAFAFGGSYDQLLPDTDLTLELLTQLANLFTATFPAPDAVASVFFVSNGSSSVPVFDGLNSYQPASANNASILWYNWTIKNQTTDTVSCSGTGAEFECPGGVLVRGVYLAILQVTNTDGLSSTTNITYTQP